MDTSRSHSVTVAGTVAGVLWTLSIAVLQAPTSAADPCPDVEIVFARGTTEPPGVGGVGEAFVDSLRSQLNGRSVGVYAIDYPASRDFDTSTPAGATDASAHIQSVAVNCPNTRMVLGGYSQGAGVIDLSTTAMPPQVADHVAAAALFGAPKSAFADTLSPARCPQSPLSTRPKPLTCACRTIQSAPTAGTCVRTSRMSRPEW